MYGREKAGKQMAGSQPDCRKAGKILATFAGKTSFILQRNFPVF